MSVSRCDTVLGLARTDGTQALYYFLQLRMDLLLSPKKSFIPIGTGVAWELASYKTATASGREGGKESP